MSKPTVVSLFAGCGGSSLGYALAGCKVLGAIEWDTHAAQTYALNFPKTRLWAEDISRLCVDDVMQILGLTPGELTILDGSPPCQGFSMAGKREVSDPRNQLFEEYLRFLRGLKPKAFVLENVPGLTQGVMRPMFAQILTALKQAGYVTSARILNAVHYGVPQNRQRLIIIGTREDPGLTPTHPTPKMLPVSFREAVRTLPSEEDESGMVAFPVGRALELARCLKPGESGAHLHKRYEQPPNDFSLFRLDWDKPSPTVCKTIRRGQCGLLHPEEDRFLSIAELKRVCSFPDDFRLEGAFEACWGRLGNAVPPLLTKAIALELCQTLYSDGLY
jgi:DNA (cytosine-5)-methyltransferase 1